MAITQKTSANMGPMPTDANRIAVPGGNWFQTKDATGTPKTSPLTVSNSAITVVVPERATQMVLYSTSNDVRVSEESDVATYFVLKASTLLKVDVSRLNNLYLIRDGGADATLQFYFTIV